LFDYSASVSYQNQYLTYIDPNIDVSDEYRNTIYDITLRSSYKASESLHLGVVLEANTNDLESNQNADSGNADISRQKYTGLLSATYIPLEELKLTGSLRIDNISDQENTQFLPAITTEYNFDDVLVGASYGRFYHAPSFNQLYWKMGGNQDLEAAHGANLNGWVEYGAVAGKVSLHMLASASYNAITNQIQWLPGKSGIWSPSNILNVVTSGVEFDGELRYEVSSPLAVTLSEQFQYLESHNKTSGSLNEGKSLPYAPKLRSVTQLSFDHISIGSFSVIVRFRSERYTDLANNPTTTLPAVSTLDLTWSSSKLDITRSLPLELRLAVNNITNVQYEEIPSFPLPGRTFTLGIQLTYNNFYNNLKQQ
jgi:vitamin B12 transporter